MGNVSQTNHVVHFLLGMASVRFSYIAGVFLLYQLIDGIKFRYRVVLDGPHTDDLPLDLLFFSLGALAPRMLQALGA